jgi:hypothetical protein
MVSIERQSGRHSLHSLVSAFITGPSGFWDLAHVVSSNGSFIRYLPGSILPSRDCSVAGVVVLRTVAVGEVKLSSAEALRLFAIRKLCKETNGADRKQDIDSNDPSRNYHQYTIFKPLIIPDATPKRSRRLLAQCDIPESSDETVDPARTGEDARQQPLPRDSAAPVPTNPEARRERRRDVILNDPSMDSLIDFSSEEGFYQFAKKKKKATQAFNWDEPEKKDEPPADGGDGNGGDPNGGDSGNAGGDGAGAGGGDGDGNGDDKDKKDEGGDANPDDEWGSFATVGKKKKKGKKGAAVEEPTENAVPEVPEVKFDSFQEIKLDDPAPALEVNFGGDSAENKGSSFGTWGTSWNTGSTWDWSGTKDGNKDKDEGPKEDADANPWSINRPKPKKKGKTTFTFGAFDEEEEKSEEPPAAAEEEKKDDDFTFSFGTSKKDKKKKKNSIWDPEPEEKKDEDPLAASQDLGSTKAAEDDLWGGGWGTTTKKKGKKGKNAVEEIKEPDPPPAPDPPAEAAPPDDDWFSGTSKKDKKKKKNIFSWDEPEPEPEPEKVESPKEEEKPAEDDFWGTISTKKKGKKGRCSIVILHADLQISLYHIYNT